MELAFRKKGLNKKKNNLRGKGASAGCTGA